MTKTLTRQSDRDIIKVPMMMFNPTTEYGERFDGDLDTGNDHTEGSAEDWRGRERRASSGARGGWHIDCAGRDGHDGFQSRQR
ncbi:hypothetical protein ACFYE9_11100 [Rhizobium leguminosarum]|uniref:Uncharacterized protein n=1 Tax=Rhizobium leguminosarum TaxID=384 RepID=A0ACD5F634_RHILE|nr:hypothetical protein [Rhizobium leguminosarum]